MVKAAEPRTPGRIERFLPFKWLTVAVVLWIYAIIVVGGFVTATGAAEACESQPTRYPLCNGELVPDFSQPGVPQEYLHRQLSLWGGFLVLLWLVQAWRTQRDRPLVPRLTTGTFLLLLLQSSIGAIRVTAVPTDRSLYAGVLTAHLALASLIFALSVVVAMLVWTPKNDKAVTDTAAEPLADPSERAVPEPAISLTASLRDHIALTKPRIVFLLLVTTLTGFVMASGPAVDLGLLGATLFAGALVAGGSEALNGFLERETDAKMKRTMRRPVRTGAPRGGLPSGPGCRRTQPTRTPTPSRQPNSSHSCRPPRWHARRGRVMATLRRGPHRAADLDGAALESLVIDGLATVDGPLASLPR